MKKVWIFGGSFCSGYQNGGEARDWIAQLDADVTLWACAPQTPLSQQLCVKHAHERHVLERTFDKPDFVIYDYPPVARVDIGLNSESDILNYRHYVASRMGSKLECGCDVSSHTWSGATLLHLLKYAKRVNPDPPDHQKWLVKLQRDILSGALPDHSQMRHTQTALDQISEWAVPYVWYSAGPDNLEELVTGHSEHYVDIHTLNNTIPKQTYNRHTPNHLNTKQNLQWSQFFNQLISHR